MEKRLEKIHAILLMHRGKGNEISSAQIAKTIGIDEDATQSQTRSLIKRTAEEYGIPLSSNNHGYFIITAEDELAAYMDNLDSRIKGIEDRKKTMTENYWRQAK